MKSVINSNFFNLKDSVEKSKGKFTLIDFFKVNILYYVVVILVNAIINLIRGTGYKILTFTNLVALAIGAIPYSIYIFVAEKNKIKNKGIAELNMFLYNNVDNELDLNLEDFSKSIIKNEPIKNEVYYLCDGKGTKVNSKKVVSYIGLTKKEKLIIFKQIASHYKYDNKDMKDAQFIELFLLDNNEMLKENFINEDGSLNSENLLVKKLLNNKK